jgi:TFIIF-interacting CTD phosphatase-like protein
LVGTYCVKDLRIISNRRLEDSVLLDNLVVSFAYQLENGIYIPSYQGDEQDNELLVVARFLRQIASVPDVRPHIKRFSGILSLYEQYRLLLD